MARLLSWYLMMGAATFMGGPYATEAKCEEAKRAFEQPPLTPKERQQLGKRADEARPSGLVLVCRRDHGELPDLMRP